MSHTPGPWRAVAPGTDGSQFLNWIVGTDVGNTLVSVVSVIAPHAVAYCEADARLIAAAPDLLAALKHVQSCDQWSRREEGISTEIMDRAWDRVRAAIAAAEGTS